VNRIRSEENRITLAERLRWSGEAIVSTGRGYLISGDAAFLSRLVDAQNNFDHGIGELMHGVGDARSTALLHEVEADAAHFRRHQEVLMGAHATGDIRTQASRFETELVPLQKKLSDSLDRMIDYKETAIDHVYKQVAGERARLRTWLHSLLASLIVASLAIAAYVATLLGRSYRKEQDALETSRKAVAGRDEIMGIVAHDLKNPLTSIAMRTELMRATSPSSAVAKHADAISSVVESMDHLIRGMLVVATI
jgi:signal transduction histidine kinase